MLLGYARCATTPPIGTALGGYYSRAKGSECLYDDLYARCLALCPEGEGECFAIAVLDVLGVPTDLYEDVVSRLREARAFVVIGATHSHAAPLPSAGDELYREYLARAVAGCVRSALRSARERVRRAVVGVSRLPQLVYNRRDPQRGPVDPTLVALDLGPVAVINYSCHPVILGPDNLCISADYPGAIVSVFERLSGKRALFLNGCCGDVNPRTPSTRLDRPYDRRGAGYDEVLWFGEVVALEALKSLRLGEAIELEDPIYAAEKVSLRVRSLPPLDEVERLVEEARGRGDVYTLRRLERLESLVRALGDRRSIEVPIAAVRLSKSLAAVFMPAEVFVEIQLEIRRSSPFRYTIVASYFNSYWGYIPTKRAFEEGGYETELPATIIEPGEGEKLVNAVIKLLAELSP